MLSKENYWEVFWNLLETDKSGEAKTKLKLKT